MNAGAPRPLYPVCSCGADLDACHREQNLDGDDSSHQRRIEWREQDGRFGQAESTEER